eukprot:snap_masked-scaffold_25-processed-gene-4.19-mRNA-1 protein AED:1.00 eAED:1.00 QI:0/-1/0/0/-1/1/1/0/78
MRQFLSTSNQVTSSNRVRLKTTHDHKEPTDPKTFLILYGDDIIVVGKATEENKFTKVLKKQFIIKDSEKIDKFVSLEH